MDTFETKIHLENPEKIEKEVLKLLNKNEEAPKSFEEAIGATGFGKYNYILLLILLLPCATQMTETVGMTYIVPIAECDLELTLEDKGILNSITFAGMITSGLFWGYLCDAIGRKKIIVYGYLITGLFSVTAALSNTKGVLLASKFMAGLILNGPYSAITAHTTEFHSARYRGTVGMIRGIFFSVMNMLLPIFAWAILPRTINIRIFGLVIHSWNVFMLICASFSVISGIVYMFLPESPKYLMSMGRNREALAIMQNVYVANTGKSKESFPVKKLVREAKMDFTSSRIEMATALKSGWSEMKTIFKRPHITNLILACFNAFAIVMSLNTLKFWMPSIFQAISDYENNHNGSSNSMCTMLNELNRPDNVTSSQTCSVNLDNVSVYSNAFIVAAPRLGIFVIAGSLVRAVGAKRLSITLTFISATCLFCIYFARSSLAVTLLSAAGTAIGSVPENLLITITLELFPTSLRTIALSIHLTSQRIGTLLGNVIFPYLVHMGCFPPFLYIGIFAYSCGIFSFFYANTENKPLR